MLSTWSNRSKRGGFTLLELMIVVGVVIMMGALTPMLVSGPILDRQMYNTAAQFQQDLLLTQNMAVTHSSGGPLDGSPRYLMRLYLGDNAFAYETTETYSAPTPSVPTPGTGIVVRQMTSVFGFPAFFGTTSPASVTIGSSTNVTSVTSGCVDVVFDNQGLPYWSQDDGKTWTTPGGTPGSIMITNSSASKRIQVTVSVIGRVSVAWVPGYK